MLEYTLRKSCIVLCTYTLFYDAKPAYVVQYICGEVRGKVYYPFLFYYCCTLTTSSSGPRDTMAWPSSTKPSTVSFQP